ncbi:MAG: metallophosphoesterase [Mucilaginibacter sp.]|nr:metallophosphoesterase [Mucilaginibacter sp.]
MAAEQQTQIRIAAVGDLHTRQADKGRWTELFGRVSSEADVLLICGDLTDTGDEAEAETLAGELKACKIPVLAVLGNHDHEKSRQKLIRQIMQQADVCILDGESVILKGIGFAGIKGFGGGFDKHMLSMFGESAMKTFVQEAVNEALSLDRAISQLTQQNQDIKIVAMMHYSPIQSTIIGEPEVIYPFLGSSRLAEPFSKRKVAVAFHGHAHVGTLEGQTAEGVKVYNVALPVLQKNGLQTGYFIYNL